MLTGLLFCFASSALLSRAPQFLEAAYYGWWVLVLAWPLWVIVLRRYGPSSGRSVPLVVGLIIMVPVLYYALRMLWVLLFGAYL